MHPKPQEGLIGHGLLGSTDRVPDSVGLDRVTPSSAFPNAANKVIHCAGNF